MMSGMLKPADPFNCVQQAQMQATGQRPTSPLVVSFENRATPQYTEVAMNQIPDDFGDRSQSLFEQSTRSQSSTGGSQSSDLLESQPSDEFIKVAPATTTLVPKASQSTIASSVLATSRSTEYDEINEPFYVNNDNMANLNPSDAELRSKVDSLQARVDELQSNSDVVELRTEVNSLKTTVTELKELVGKQSTFIDSMKAVVENQINVAFQAQNLPQLTQKVVDALALVNSKCETMAVQSEVFVRQPVATVNMCNTVDELVAFNEKCKDIAFINSIIAYKSRHFGKNRKIGEGRSVANTYIDEFIDRSVFLEVCWTGVGRDKKTKVAFQEMKAFMNMWMELISYSDPEWTLAQNNEFFHAILDNSTGRAKAGPPKLTPTQRDRVKTARKRMASATATSNQRESSSVTYVVNPNAGHIQYVDENNVEMSDVGFNNVNIVNEHGEPIQFVYSVDQNNKE